MLGKLRKCRTRAPAGVAGRVSRIRTPSTPGLLIALLIGFAEWAVPPRMLAQQVIVPDHYATIQEAIDSGAHEILVRPGVYPERPVLRNLWSNSNDDVTLRGLVPSGASPDSLPVLAGLAFDNLIGGYTHTPSFTIAHLRFSGAVRNYFFSAPYSNPLNIIFSHCVLEAGIDDSEAHVGGQLEYAFRSCTIDGGAFGAISLLQPDRAYIDSCVVKDRVRFGRQSWSTFFIMTNSHVTSPAPSPGSIGVKVYAENGTYVRGTRFEGYEIPVQIAPYAGTGVELTGNTFVGPGRYAVDLGESSLQAYLRGNSIAGYDVGVRSEHTPNPNDGGVTLYSYDNRIVNCGTGILATGAGHIEVSRDTIASCGAGAILLANDTYGTPGVFATGNVILSCTGNGMSVWAEDARIDGNVVGRCGGNGIVATIGAKVWWEAIRLRRNTSFLNGGSGYSITFQGSDTPGVIDHNTGHGNGRYGLELTTSHSMAIGCNDWFTNTLGAVQGIAPSPTDFATDPLFCDLEQNDVRLAKDSPLADAAGCGLIGALGIGCGSTPVLVEHFTAWRSPDGGIVVGWRVSGEPTMPLHVERAGDARGPWAPVDGTPEFNGQLLTLVDRTVDPARDYWYRLIEGDLSAGGSALATTFVEAYTRGNGFGLEATRGNLGPGPFTIRFRAPRTATVELAIFDIQGRRIAELASGKWPAGVHELRWSGHDAHGRPQTGLHLVRYRYPGGQATQRLVLIR